MVAASAPPAQLLPEPNSKPHPGRLLVTVRNDPPASVSTTDSKPTPAEEPPVVSKQPSEPASKPEAEVCVRHIFKMFLLLIGFLLILVIKSRSNLCPAIYAECVSA